MDRNNTTFPAELYEELKQVPESQDDIFFYHQRLTYSYVLKNPNTRGLLICYNTGYGKTITASALAEMGREQGWDVIILATKSLHDNFKKGLIKYRKSLPKYKNESETAIGFYIDDEYKFVSSNASNMAEQLARAAKDVDSDLEDKIGAMSDTISTLEGKYLIVDEAHNLFNSITNPDSKNARKFYEMVMNTKKIKIIFLTANPIVNDPIELVSCFNMLQGYMVDEDGKKKTLFPEDWSDFYKYFVDMEHLCLKNADKFKNRILGLVSYYGSIYEGNPKSQTGRKDVITRKNFPDEAPTITVNVEMSDDQYAAYVIAEDQEKREASKVFGQRQKIAMARPGLISASTYKIKTRQISNYLMPKYVDPKSPPETRPGQILEVDLKNLDTFGPKIRELKKNLVKHPKNIIYSQFLNGTIKVIERNLEIDEIDKILWIKWDPNKVNKKRSTVRIYAEISGDISKELRTEILDAYNDKNNMYGEKLNDLFITAAGSEGLDTTNVDATHQIEPYWNPSRDKQVRARAIRLNSHQDRPPKDRIVQPYLYLAIAPKKSTRKTPTTDQDLHTRSIDAVKLNQSFMNALIESAVDCLIHSQNSNAKAFEEMGLKCVMCQPTDKKLFTANVEDDIKSKSPCHPYQEEKIKVMQIKVDGKKYYYRRNENNQIEAYEYSDNLDVYVPIDEQTDLYEQIVSKI